MKITQSKVRVESNKPAPGASNSAKNTAAPKPNIIKPASPAPAAVKPPPPQVKRASTPVSIQPIVEQKPNPAQSLPPLGVFATAKQELDAIRRMRAAAERYQVETATRARSEAHQLVLSARLATQREIENVIRKASDEIQKVLADIRVIRISAQEELAAQRKFTDAAKLSSMSLAVNRMFQKPPAEKKPKKKLESVKS
jgi:hypothetical protein